MGKAALQPEFRQWSWVGTNLPLFQMEDLFQRAHGAVGGAAVEVDEELAHFSLPAGVHFTGGHAVETGLEIFTFDVADKQAIGAKKQRVVAPSGIAQRLEHLGPDFAVALLVLIEPVGFDLEKEAVASHLWHDIGCHGGNALARR